MSAQSHARPAELLEDGLLRRLAAATLVDAQLSDVIARLDDSPEYRSHAGDEASEYLADLLSRRAGLLRAERLHPVVDSDVAERPLSDAVAAIANLFGFWKPLYLSYMSEGINDTPGVSGTHGSVVTSGLFAGGCAYGGEVTDDGTVEPNTDKWWTHNWQNTAVFPPAPFSGRLHYRFVVESESHVYRDPCRIGSLREFVTIGTTANAAIESPGNWATVGWPVDVTLPYPGQLSFGASVPVSGSIAVAEGNQAALGFVYGTIVSVASGYVQFLWGNFGTRRVVSAGGTVGPSDFDQIEYRFEPIWWIEAVNRRALEIR